MMFQLTSTAVMVYIEILRMNHRFRMIFMSIISAVVVIASAVLIYLATGPVFFQGQEISLKDASPLLISVLITGILALGMGAFSFIDKEKADAILERNDDDQILRSIAGSYFKANFPRDPVNNTKDTTTGDTKQEETIIQAIQGNLGHLVEYYIMNKGQARSSYRWSLTAVVVGFATIIGGAWWAYTSQRSDSAVYIAPVGGVLLQFIGGGYFYLYNRSLIQLNFFFSRLVQVQDTMLAIHLAESLPEGRDRSKALERLVFIVAERGAVPPAYLSNSAAKATSRRPRNSSKEPSEADSQ